MIDKNTIEEVKQRLVATYNPVAIYIFGSYAWGNPAPDSDLDLLVVVEQFKKDKYHDLVEGHRALSNMPISKDLLLYTKQEFDTFSLDATRLCYKIKHDGELIYAKP